MTAADLRRLLAELGERVTPGPWSDHRSVHGSKYRFVQIGTDDSYTTLELLPEDAKLISTLRNNLPQILDALAQVREDCVRAPRGLIQACAEHLEELSKNADSMIVAGDLRILLAAAEGSANNGN